MKNVRFIHWPFSTVQSIESMKLAFLVDGMRYLIKFNSMVISKFLLKNIQAILEKALFLYQRTAWQKQRAGFKVFFFLMQNQNFMSFKLFCRWDRSKWGQITTYWIPLAFWRVNVHQVLLVSLVETDDGDSYMVCSRTR